MALSQAQIEVIRQKAKARGLSDQQINAGITSLNSGSVRPVSQPQATTPSPSLNRVSPVNQTTNASISPIEQPQESFASKFFKSLYEPVTNTARNIVGTPIALASLALEKGGSKKGILEKTAEKILPEKAVKDPKANLNKQLKDSVAVASWGVPFGKGANLATKVLLPGAAVGGLNTVASDEFEPETVGEGVKQIAGGMVGGAAGGAALHGAGKVLGKVAQKSGVLNKLGNAVDAGARKIRIRANQVGINSARTEKSINDTFNRWIGGGSAQQQFERVEPAMKNIETKISEHIKANPNKTVSLETIYKIFKKELKPMLRAKDITKKEAQEEFASYIFELARHAGYLSKNPGQKALLKSGQGEFTLEVMRKLKKLTNIDYKTAINRANKGQDLSARQKVMVAAWKSVDKALRKAAPEIKELLIDERNLFLGNPMVAAARSNPPTLRALGISIPAGVTQLGRDAISGTLKGAGKVAGAVDPAKLPEGSRLAGKIAGSIVGGNVVSSALNQGNNEDGVESSLNGVTPVNPGKTGNVPNALQDNNGGGDINGDQGYQQNGLNHNNNVAPFGGRSKKELLQLALADGASAKDLKEISDMYDMVVGTSGTMTPETMNTANSLRTEYFKRTQENGYLDVLNSYNKLMNTSNSAQGDISLVFAYMKMLDPGSVVREGEYATAENTAGVSDRIRNAYNKALSGKRLNEDQRAAYKSEAQSIFAQYQATQDQIDNFYYGLSSRYGIDPGLVGVGTYGLQPVQPQQEQTSVGSKKKISSTPDSNQVASIAATRPNEKGLLEKGLAIAKDVVDDFGVKPAYAAESNKPDPRNIPYRVEPSKDDRWKVKFYYPSGAYSEINVSDVPKYAALVEKNYDKFKVGEFPKDAPRYVDPNGLASKDKSVKEPKGQVKGAATSVASAIKTSTKLGEETYTPFNPTIQKEFGRDWKNATRALRFVDSNGEIKGENTGLLYGKEIDIENRIDPKTGKWKADAPIAQKYNPFTDKNENSIDRGLFRINNGSFYELLNSPKYRKQMFNKGIIDSPRLDDLTPEKVQQYWDRMLEPEKNIKMAKVIFNFHKDISGKGWSGWYGAPDDLRELKS